MEELRLCPADRIGVLDQQRPFCRKRIDVNCRKGRSGLNGGARPRGPNRAKMALSSAGGANQYQQRVRPVWPELDHRKSLFVGLRYEEIFGLVTRIGSK